MPQDEVGDCSRLLANFYLQAYDEFMRDECLKAAGRGEFVRFADDQFIMTQESRDARLILFNASTELHKIGLNINSGKVIEFSGRVDFDYYNAFDFFKLLGNPNDRVSVTAAASEFIERTADTGSGRDQRQWRSSSVPKRLISVGLDKIDEPTRSAFVKLLLEKDFVSRSETWMWAKMLPHLTDLERTHLFEAIDILVDSVHYNRFHLSVLKLYQIKTIGRDLTPIKRRIEELRYV